MWRMLVLTTNSSGFILKYLCNYGIIIILKIMLTIITLLVQQYKVDLTK